MLIYMVIERDMFERLRSKTRKSYFLGDNVLRPVQAWNALPVGNLSLPLGANALWTNGKSLLS